MLVIQLPTKDDVLRINNNMRTFNINRIQASNYNKLFLIAGPCQIQSQDHAQFTAGAIKEICDELGIDFVYKSSFDKANRSSLGTQRGVGIDQGLAIMNSIKHTFGVPVLTDIHESYQAELCATAGIDIIQIPAFLCRQTDLLLAAGETGCAINVKKGQFLAPHDMKNVAAKIVSTGNERIMLCERGYTHGYNNLVVDMRSLPIMASTGYPVVFDATHSVQQPGGLGSKSGGDRTMVPYLARAAVATGCVAGVFIETHEDPDAAPSDGPNMIKLSELKSLLKDLVAIDGIVKRTTQASQD
jgi:2-dehydro-3-deoxyphosphooctonate aldolase (KDO 8-P synthase)